MSLNIKNERVHELARRAAALTGKTQTGAIQEALERFIAERSADPGADPEEVRQRRIDLLWSEITADTSDADRARTRRTMDELYDDSGLPR
ncbi:MAG TPA: type II toxin-antitoxin system VapB family antitoxin [Marmoricola sp.]